MERRTYDREGRTRGNNQSNSDVIGGYRKVIEDEKGQMQFNKKLFFGVLIGGTIGLLVDKLLYGALYNNIPNIVLFGLIMMIFTLGILGGSIVSTVTYNVDSGKAVIAVIVCAVAMFMLGIVFEFIYEIDLRPKTTAVPADVSISDYIFCIDDSGSMGENDPNNERYVAFNDIINQLDENNNVGLIRFAGKAFATANPKPLNEKQIQDFQDTMQKGAGLFGGAGTNFEKPLKSAYKMYEKLGISGRNQIVVLLSDGQAGLDIDEMTSIYNEAGIIICSVFLGEGEMPEILTELAEETGGIALSVTDANELIDTFKNIVSKTDRKSTDVGTYRRFIWNARTFSDQYNVLAMIERVVFFTVFGLLFGLAFYVILGQALSLQRYISLLEGFLCGVLLEVGFGLELPDGFVRSLIIVMAFVFAKYMTNGKWELGYTGEIKESAYKTGDIHMSRGNEYQNQKRNHTAKVFDEHNQQSGSGRQRTGRTPERRGYEDNNASSGRDSRRTSTGRDNNRTNRR